MLKDLLNTYKYGWKTSYYQNTYDYKTDGDVEEPQHPLGWHDNVKENPVERTEFNGTDEEYEEYCDSCAIQRLTYKSYDSIVVTHVEENKNGKNSI